jgi:hypothetical protein
MRRDIVTSRFFSLVLAALTLFVFPSGAAPNLSPAAGSDAVLAMRSDPQAELRLEYRVERDTVAPETVIVGLAKDYHYKNSAAAAAVAERRQPPPESVYRARTEAAPTLRTRRIGLNLTVCRTPTSFVCSGPLGRRAKGSGTRIPSTICWWRCRRARSRTSARMPVTFTQDRGAHSPHGKCGTLGA